MNYTQYHRDTSNTSTDIEQTGQDAQTKVNNTLSGRMILEDSSVYPDENPGTLQTVVDGILSGASPLQFMDSINAGNQQLGNRAFLQFVGELHARRQHTDTHGIAAKGLQSPGQPLTHLDTLQQAFGHHDISEMREHTGPETEAALDMLGAEAYSSGGRMALAGTPDLFTQAHEAAHGVQQVALGGGLQLKGGIGEAGDQYERQADAVAEAVVRGQSAQPLLDEMAEYPTIVTPGAITAEAPVQMKWPDKNLEDLTMEEFEGAIQEMTDEELDEAWEELTLMIEIMELEEQIKQEVKSKPEGGAKKVKKGRAKPTPEEIEAMRAAKKAKDGGGGKKQKSSTATETTASPQTSAAEASTQSVTGSAKPKHKQQKKASTGKGEAKKGGKPTLDQISGLDDMFLARAINHLITGELYELDPIIGDEGCQIRTPFVLDMYRLVQRDMPTNAVDLVDEYRTKAEVEQLEVFKHLKELESDRTGKDENRSSYESSVLQFIKSNPLQKSINAISGPYETMFQNLLSSIKRHYPEGVSYLSHVCSEGAIYWESVLDHFGLSVMPNQNPIFPNALLARRKMAQSRWSKKYMALAAAKLLSMGGGKFSEVTKELGPDKKETMQADLSFLMAQSKKENIAVMLLHAVQMHSGAAVTRGERLELGPYWETTRLVLTYALKQGYPLLVNLRRLIVSREGADRKYSSNICQTLFYEPTDQGYKYQPDPSEAQRSQGALLFQGFSMLRKGDTNIPGATLPIAPWVFEEDPEKFLTGFTACDVANLMLVGDVGTHHPLNTGGRGSGAYAYGLPGGSGVYSFDHDPGGWKYADAIHDLTLSDLGQGGMTQQGLEYLTPEFELADKSKGLLFPDQCPVNIAGTGSEFNIKEEYQLMKLLCQAAGMKDTMYAKHDRKTKTAERVAQSTMPFVSTHILASTFAHENEISEQFAAPKKRGIIETLDELCRK